MVRTDSLPEGTEEREIGGAEAHWEAADLRIRQENSGLNDLGDIRVWYRFRKSGLLVATWTAVVRVFVGVVISELALRVIPLRGYPPVVVTNPRGSLTGGFFSWDAGVFYQGIALHGYPSGNPSTSSFFPLYPLLGRGLSYLPELTYQRAALLLSWVALIAATAGVNRLSKDVFPESQATRAGWFLCWFPASVFLIAGYAESLFIALSVWALVALYEKRPWVAAVLFAFAGATRPEGAVLALAILLWALLEVPRRYMRAVLLLVVSELGFVAFSLFQWVHFGNPLESVLVQHDDWHRDTTWPLHTLIWSLTQIVQGHITGPMGSAAGASGVTAAFLIDDAAILGTLGAFALLIYLGRRRIEFIWLLLPSALVLVGIISNGPSGLSPEAAVRYVMCLPPIYLLPGLIKREYVWSGLLVGSAALAVFFQIVFNLGGWFT